MGKETKNEEMSLSKQRKIARKQAIAKQKRQAVLNKIILVVVVLAVIGLIAFLIIQDRIKKSKQVTADTNYSAQLDENGKIKNIKAADYITLPDYNNISLNLSDIEYSDEKVESDITTLLNNKQYVDDSDEKTAADGDKVSIDYTGTIDGEEFDSGSGTDYALTLGSGSFIDTFEEQIVGHKPGDEFTVNVKFPDDYDKEELAGKDAAFAVTLKGIYTTPEFTDEFVKENLSEYASTTDEYRKYLKDTNYKKNLENAIMDYAVANTQLKSYPSDYLKQLKGNHKADEQYYYEYMNQMYSTYLGTQQYTSFADYLQKTYSMTEEEYDESLEEKVTDSLKYALFCQAVADAEGITVTYDQAKEYYLANGGTEDNFESQTTTYGKEYLTQQYLCTKVIETISQRATVA